jgi:hypothetical protein
MNTFPGTDVKIFNCEKVAFLLYVNKAKLYKNGIITLVFEKNANLFAENCQKLQKIVIITSTQELTYVSSNYILAESYCFQN